MENLEKQLTDLQNDLKTYFAKAKEEEATRGTVLKETKDAIDGLTKRVDGLTKCLDQIEVKMARPNGGGAEQKSLIDTLKENESVQRLMKDKRGSAVVEFKSLADLEQKTTITSTAVGSATFGILQPQVVPGIVRGVEVRLTVRDLLPSAPTDANAISYIKENVFTNAASPQVEGSAKAESALTFTTATANVRTLAHWIPATRQVLDDFQGLGAYINSKLIYGLKYKEEQELLSGDNTGEHLNGLITQATAFNTALLSNSDGWEKVDILRRTIQQVDVASEMPTDFFIINPADWADIELSKDANGNYMIGSPRQLGNPAPLWGKQVIVTPAITSGTFLAGARNQAQIRDRMGVTVEISTEHSTYFTQNMVAIRCEERLALCVFRPAAFITGSLTTSPA